MHFFVIYNQKFSCINSEAYKVFEANLIETLCKPLEGLLNNVYQYNFFIYR